MNRIPYNAQRVIIAVSIFAAMAVIIIWAAYNYNKERVAKERIEIASNAPNSPLDRITYAAPSWSTKQTYLITDRRSGHKWWVVNIEGDWVELDISE